MKRLFILLSILLCLSVKVLTAQQTASYVAIEGEVVSPLKLSLEKLLLFKASEIEAKDKDGKQHTFKGVFLWDILDSAGVTQSGKSLVKYVVARASDGYEVIFSLPEIDPAFSDKIILVAYEVNGKPLALHEGPFRLVVPDEKKHARWVRQLTRIKVLVSKN